MNQLNNSVKNNEKGAIDFAKSIAGYTTAYGVAVQVGQKVISTLGNMASETVSLAAGFERSKQELAVLFGSVEKGNKAFEDWYDIAAKTPLAFNDIANTGTRLASVRIPLEQIGDKIKMLGDVSGGNAEKLARLTDAYAQLKSRGVASMEQINRFTEAGVPIMEELSKQFGVGGVALFKLVEQGRVGFKDMDSALKNMTSQGGLYYQMMDKVSQTTAGRWSTAQDNFRMMLAKIGEKALPAINAALDAFNKLMAGAPDPLKDTANYIDMKTKEIDKLKEAIAIVKENVRNHTLEAYVAQDIIDKTQIRIEGIEELIRGYKKQHAAELLLAELEDKRKQQEQARLDQETKLASLGKDFGPDQNSMDDYLKKLAEWKNEQSKLSNPINREGTFFDKSVWDTLDESTRKSIENAKKMEEQWKMVSKVMAESLVGAASAFGQALIEGQDPAKAFFKTIIDSVGNAVIAYAALTEAQGWATWPISDWTKIGAGISLAVLGGTIKGIAASMAEGGLVKAQPGGTAVILAEAGEDEFVIPRSKMASAMGKQGNTYIYAPQIAGSVIREREIEAIGARGFMRMMRNY